MLMLPMIVTVILLATLDEKPSWLSQSIEIVSGFPVFGFAFDVTM